MLKIFSHAGPFLCNEKIIGDLRLVIIFFLTLFSFFTLNNTLAGKIEKFEEIPLLKASDLMPGEVLSGPHHQVEENVTNDGFTNYYNIQSDFGYFNAFGNDMLIIRVQEIYALAKITEIKNSKMFTDSMAAAAMSPLQGAYNTITDPVGTVASVPKGVSRFIGRAGRKVTGANVKAGEHYKDNTAAAILGYTKAKKEIAKKLSVDPYSTNEQLQNGLKDLAWASVAGGMSVNMALRFSPIGLAGLAISSANRSNKVRDLAEDLLPNEIPDANLKLLKEGGEIENSMAKHILHHPWYSPTQKNLVCWRIAHLEAVTDFKDFCTIPLQADSIEDAFLFQRTSDLIAHIDQHYEKIVKIEAEQGFIVCNTEKGKRIIPIPIDYGFWTKETAAVDRKNMNYFDRISRRSKGQTQIWITGILSDRFKEEMNARYLRVVENAFELYTDDQIADTPPTLN